MEYLNFIKDPMVLGLLAIAGFAAWALHKNQIDQSVDFDLRDLLMENGKVSKIACTFMAAFALTSWVILKLTLDGKMTEGYLTSYGLMWVAPLVSKVVFNKTEAPKP